MFIPSPLPGGSSQFTVGQTYFRGFIDIPTTAVEITDKTTPSSQHPSAGTTGCTKLLVKRNYTVSFRLMSSAAKQGHVGATAALAVCFLTGYMLVLPGSDIHHRMTSCYFDHGSGIPSFPPSYPCRYGLPPGADGRPAQRNPSKAFALFEQAAFRQDVESMGKVGSMYVIYSSSRCDQNVTRTFASIRSLVFLVWYTHYLLLLSCICIYRYMTGVGVDRDEKKGVQWLKLAASR